MFYSFMINVKCLYTVRFLKQEMTFVVGILLKDIIKQDLQLRLTNG